MNWLIIFVFVFAVVYVLSFVAGLANFLADEGFALFDIEDDDDEPPVGFPGF